MTILLALAIAAAPSLEPLCDEQFTVTRGGQTFVIGYDCSGPKGVLWAVPNPREVLCRGPVAFIANDDPGLALFRTGRLADRKVALAIERANSCDPAERVPEGQPWFCEGYDADRQPRVPGCIHEPRGETR